MIIKDTETLTDFELEVILDRGDVSVIREGDGEIHVFISSSNRVDGGYLGSEIDRYQALYERIDQGIRSGDLVIAEDGMVIIIDDHEIHTNFVNHAE